MLRRQQHSATMDDDAVMIAVEEASITNSHNGLAMWMQVRRAIKWLHMGQIKLRFITASAMAPTDRDLCLRIPLPFLQGVGAKRRRR